MSDTTKAKLCPKCGQGIPDDAPQGLCPRCVLAEATVPVPPPPAQAPHEAPPLRRVVDAFPHLEILELIGMGGMGAVFKARQPKLDRWVALKILPETLAQDPAFAERFSREARLLARLNHPGIVTVYDFGQAGDLFYLMMEYVDGVNLRQAMAAGRFSPPEALAIVPKICEAIQFAHDNGVLHRDIKPENILLNEQGRIKIADFGIAKLVVDSPDQATLTAQGTALGTPHYMAPEQLERPQEVDERADIYSLGVVFYEMLTGQLPLGRFALPSESSTVDPRVDPIVLRTLERDREKRYRTATEVQTNVEGLQSSPPLPPVAPANLPQTTPPPPPSSTPLPRTPGKAITAAILAGIGIPLTAPFFIFAVTSIWFLGTDSGGIGILELLLVGILSLAWLACSLAGMLVGISAVHDIRNHPPPRKGLGLATFAVATFPLLLLNAFVLGSAFVLLALSGGLLPLIVLLALAALGLPVVVVLNVFIIQRIRAWAQGTHETSPTRSGRGATLTLVAAGSLVLLLGLTLVLPLLWRQLSATHPRRTAGTASRLTSNHLQPIPWLPRGPLLDLNVHLPARHTATFSLMESNAAGLKSIPHSEAYVLAADRVPFQGNLQWGWVASPDDPSQPPLFHIEVTDPESGSASSSNTALSPEDFASAQVRLSLDLEPGNPLQLLVAPPASSIPTSTNQERPSLWLQVHTQPRPDSPAHEPLRVNALIGVGRPKTLDPQPNPSP